MNLFSTVLAQSVAIPQPEGLTDFTVPGLIQFAVGAILVVAGLIFFFMLIIGGLRWILSGGDKAATESARSQITAALIGLVIVFSAWAIATFMTSIFGVDILNLSLPELGTGTGGS
jgi:hypothetical protein